MPSAGWPDRRARMPKHCLKRPVAIRSSSPRRWPRPSIENCRRRSATRCWRGKGRGARPGPRRLIEAAAIMPSRIELWLEAVGGVDFVHLDASWARGCSCTPTARSRSPPWARPPGRRGRDRPPPAHPAPSRRAAGAVEHTARADRPRAPVPSRRRGRRRRGGASPRARGGGAGRRAVRPPRGRRAVRARAPAMAPRSTPTGGRSCGSAGGTSVT